MSTAIKSIDEDGLNCFYTNDDIIEAQEKEKQKYDEQKQKYIDSSFRLLNGKLQAILNLHKFDSEAVILEDTITLRKERLKRLQNESDKLFIPLYDAIIEFYSNQPKGKDYSGLYEALKKYVSGISENDFNEVMEFKNLPNGSTTAHWIGSKADALRFADHFNFTMKQLNDCFCHIKGRFNDNNRDKTGTVSDISDILKKY